MRARRCRRPGLELTTIVAQEPLAHNDRTQHGNDISRLYAPPPAFNCDSGDKRLHLMSLPEPGCDEPGRVKPRVSELSGLGATPRPPPAVG